MVDSKILLGVGALGVGLLLLNKTASGDPNLMENGRIDFATAGISQSFILRSTIQATNTGEKTSNFDLFLTVFEESDDGSSIPVITKKLLPTLTLDVGEEGFFGAEINLASDPFIVGYNVLWELKIGNKTVDSLSRNIARPD